MITNTSILNYVSLDHFRQSSNLKVKEQIKLEDEQYDYSELDNGDGLQEAIDHNNSLNKGFLAYFL